MSSTLNIARLVKIRYPSGMLSMLNSAHLCVSNLRLNEIGYFFNNLLLVNYISIYYFYNSIQDH